MSGGGLLSLQLVDNKIYCEVPDFGAWNMTQLTGLFLGNNVVRVACRVATLRCARVTADDVMTLMCLCLVQWDSCTGRFPTDCRCSRA
jgi:hypothetical protein